MILRQSFLDFALFIRRRTSRISRTSRIFRSDLMVNEAFWNTGKSEA